MTIPFVDLKSQYDQIKTEVDSVISEVINETAFIGGRYVKNFEEKFQEKYGVKHCIGVANGTDAIYIALKMLGIGKGDEVITVANSWISTSETISQTGATPVFVDIDPDYYTIDSTKIVEKITPNTKAIIPVHLYGQAAAISEIINIAKKYNIPVIEDCAQAHFSEENNQKVGTFGIAGTFSFYPGKNLGAYGDAGCIITNDDEFAEKCRMYANHGALKKHHHKIEGINSRLDGIQAGVLSVKLAYIQKWTEERIQNANLYVEYLREVEEIVLPKVRTNTKHTFHLFVIRTKQRNQLKDYLENNGVATAIHYPTALPNLPAYNYISQSPDDFKIATRFQDEILSLPMYPELDKSSINYISELIKSYFN